MCDGNNSLSSTYQISSTGSQGTHSQKIASSGMGDGQVAWVYQYINIEPNQAYTLIGQFLVESLANAKVQLHIDFLNGQGQYIGANV
jgi:hypothetical protein